MAEIGIPGRAPALAVAELREPPRRFGLFSALSASRTPWNASSLRRAIVLGTIATVVYLLSLTVVFGVVPTSKLVSP